MRGLILSDTQIGAGANLTVDRLSDQEEILGRIADLADSRDVDFVVHCGDVFEHRHPSEEARMVFKRWAKRISTGRPLIIISGNHDVRSAEAASAVDQHAPELYTFARRPQVIDLDGLSVACLPWTPLAQMIASTDMGDRDLANQRAVSLLLQAAAELREQCDGPAILALHWWVEGAGDVDPAFIGEPVLPLADLEALGFDQIVAGHVHDARRIFRVVSVGSPYICSFGEADQPHGCWIVKTEREAGGVEGSVGQSADGDYAAIGSAGQEVGLTASRSAAEFVPFEERRFVTVDVDLGAPDPDPLPMLRIDETDQIAQALAAEFPLSDAVVRIRYRATEEQHRRVDVNALRKLLADAGAHRLYQVAAEIFRPVSARAAGVDETTTPAAALALWMDENVDVGQMSQLRGLFDGYMERVTS